MLDKKTGKNIRIPIHPTSNEKGGLAIHATSAIDGNVLVGPDLYITKGYRDYKATREHMDGLYRGDRRMLKETKPEYLIRDFAGVRWKIYDPKTRENKDFALESDNLHPCTVNLVRIGPPGVTYALPLAGRAVTILKERGNPRIDPSFSSHRRGIRRFSDMDQEEKKEATTGNPDYGEVIYRYGMIARAEILQAVHSPLRVRTITGIKDRTRATMG